MVYCYRYVYQEWYSKIRGLVPVKLWYDVKKVIIGNDTIDILFDGKEELAAYVDFAMEPLEDMEIGSGYTRLDMGYALLELYTPENGIKFTFKKGPCPVHSGIFTHGRGQFVMLMKDSG